MNCKILVWLIALLILFSIFSSSYEAGLLMSGSSNGLLNVEAPWYYRLPREIILGVICIIWSFFVRNHNNTPSKGIRPFHLMVYFTVCYIVALSLITCLSYDVIIPILGLRIFEYLPIAVITYWYCKNFEVDYFKKVIVSMLKIFILVETVFSFYELIYSPTVVGKTIFGTRVYGTFSNPNTFSITIAAIALLFIVFKVKNNKKWMLLLLLLTILSGTRMAQISIMSIFFITILINKVKSFSLRTSLIQIFPLFLFFMYLVVKSSFISGRSIVQEERLLVWADILDDHLNIKDLIFGWGVGLGSNSLTTIFGANFYEGQFVSDSTYILLLAHFGISGIFLFFLFLFYPFKILSRVNSRDWLLIVTYIILAGSSISVFEIFPVNVLLFMLVGYVIALNKKEKLEVQKQ